MAWVMEIHLYMEFFEKSSADTAVTKLEAFIDEILDLGSSLLAEVQEDNSVTIQETNNEIYNFDETVQKLQAFCRKTFQKELEGSWREEDQNGAQYVNELINGNIESENGEWVLDFPISTIRKLKAIAEIITQK